MGWRLLAVLSGGQHTSLLPGSPLVSPRAVFLSCAGAPLYPCSHQAQPVFKCDIGLLMVASPLRRAAEASGNPFSRNLFVQGVAQEISVNLCKLQAGREHDCGAVRFGVW